MKFKLVVFLLIAFTLVAAIDKDHIYMHHLINTPEKHHVTSHTITKTKNHTELNSTYCEIHTNIFCKDKKRVSKHKTPEIGNPHTLSNLDNDKRHVMPKNVKSKLSVVPHIESVSSIKSGQVIYEQEAIIKTKENVRFKMKKDQVGVEIKY